MQIYRSERLSNRSHDCRSRAEFRSDAIERVMREQIRETIEQLVAEELAAAFGAGKSIRVGEQRTGIGTS